MASSRATARAVGMTVAGGAGAEVGLRVRRTPHQVLGRLLILLHLATATHRVVEVLILMVVVVMVQVVVATGLVVMLVVIVVDDVVDQDAVRLLLALRLWPSGLLVGLVADAVAV